LESGVLAKFVVDGFGGQELEAVAVMFEAVVEELEGSFGITQVRSREGFPAGAQEAFVSSLLQVVLPESAQAAVFEGFAAEQ
jgi:hypothetical protein